MLTAETRAMIEREFPNYPLDSLPEDIPEFMSACPWHNEACPSWGDQGQCGQAGEVNLYIDYPDPQTRDVPEAVRFTIFIQGPDGYGGDILEEGRLDTDSWEEAKAHLFKLYEDHFRVNLAH